MLKRGRHFSNPQNTNVSWRLLASPSNSQDTSGYYVIAFCVFIFCQWRTSTEPATGTTCTIYRMYVRHFSKSEGIIL